MTVRRMRAAYNEDETVVVISQLSFLGCLSEQPPIFVLNLCQVTSSKQEEKGIKNLSSEFE